MQALKFTKNNNILIPILFILNMLEVILTVKHFTPLYKFSGFTFTTFSIGIVVISILIILLYRLSEKIKEGEFYNRFNIGLLHYLLVIVLVCYIGGFLYFKRYIPGMISGLVLIIPIGIYIFREVKKLHLLNNKMINSSLVIALMLIAITVFAFFIANLFDPVLYPVVIE